MEHASKCIDDTQHSFHQNQFLVCRRGKFISQRLPFSCQCHLTSTLPFRILSQLAHDLSNTDDIVGNACADALAIAFSYDQLDAPILQDALIPGATIVLSNLSDAIRKYGNGEKIDIPRVSKLMKSTGMCLAATTATTGRIDETTTLGEARLKCVDALFLMLGSTSFRKDEEVALWAGEALADYSDSFSPKDVTWSTKEDTWPPDNNEEFALRLPPHQQVRVVTFLVERIPTLDPLHSFSLYRI